MKQCVTFYEAFVMFIVRFWQVFNPIRPSLFSRFRGPDAKNQGYLIEMKLYMSQYSHGSMPDANFESGSISGFGDMTSQNFPLKRGTSHKIRIFTPGKWILL